MKAVPHILFFLMIFFAATAFAQDTLRNQPRKLTDSINNSANVTSVTAATDTLKKPKADTVVKHDPRKATRRSAILPGWGQAYNREYWKIPLVYTAIGIPAGFYIYN